MKRLLIAILSMASFSALLTSCAPGDPFGIVESVNSTVFGVQVKGWVTDTSDPDRDVGIHVYVDEKFVLEGWARTDRPEVAKAIPELEQVHGYEIALPVQTKGKHKVCVYAINIGVGKNHPQLGCETITSTGHGPVGSFDSLVNRGDSLIIDGWSIDPSSEEPVQIDTYIDGKFLQSNLADAYSKNLAVFLGKEGANRAFSFTLPKDFVVASTICLYARNVGRGYDKALGCKKRPKHTVNVNGIEIAAPISGKLAAMVKAAQADGLNLTGGGYRTHEEQIAFRRQNCGTSHYAVYDMPSGSCNPPTARPGRSMHEIGEAVDFKCNGKGMGSRSSPCYGWLKVHAAKYGFFNLPSEPWHWSTNGS